MTADDEPHACDPPCGPAGAAVDGLLASAAELHGRGLTDEQLAVYDDLVRRYADDPAPYVRGRVAEALVFKGRLLLERPEAVVAAIDAFDEVLVRFGGATELELREQVGGAITWKAGALIRLGRAEEAIEAYDDLIAGFDAAIEPELVAQLGFALDRKAANLIRLSRHEEAFAACADLLHRFADEPSGAQLTARALQRQADLLRLNGQLDEAIVVTETLLGRPDGGKHVGQLVVLGDMLIEKAAGLVAAKRWEEALVVFDGLVGRFGDAADPALRGRVVLALSNSVFALMALGRFDEATATHKEMVGEFADEALATFGDLASRFVGAVEPEQRRHGVGALVNRAGVLEELDRQAEALTAYDALIVRFDDDPDEMIQDFVNQARLRRATLADGRPGGEAAG